MNKEITAYDIFGEEEVAKQEFYNEEQVYKMTLEALELGMQIRQDQLNGYFEKSGKELHKEWFENYKK